MAYAFLFRLCLGISRNPDRDMCTTLSLFWHLVQQNAERVGHALAVCRVCLQAVADMTDLDLPRRVADGSRGVGKFAQSGAHEDLYATIR
jgi:hypothetical protein